MNLGLDLFCCAGGASAGYTQAGYTMIGVDLTAQPHYPYEFIQADAITTLDTLLDGGTVAGWALREFTLIHASPPCQAWSGMTNSRPGVADTYPQLIDATRERLIRTGVPWVIENVVGSPVPSQGDLFGNHGLMLCGLMVGLDLYRHRLFETSIPVPQPSHPKHLVPASRAGHWEPGTIVSVAGHCGPMHIVRKAMGIDWMNSEEISEAIPPLYTKYIGEHMQRRLCDSYHQ